MHLILILVYCVTVVWINCLQYTNDMIHVEGVPEKTEWGLPKYKNCFSKCSLNKKYLYLFDAPIPKIQKWPVPKEKLFCTLPLKDEMSTCEIFSASNQLK